MIGSRAVARSDCASRTNLLNTSQLHENHTWLRSPGFGQVIIAIHRESLQHMVLLSYRTYSGTLQNAPSHMIQPLQNPRGPRDGTTLPPREPHTSNDANICRDTGWPGPMTLFHNFPSCHDRPLGSVGKLPLNFLTPLARISYNRIAGTYPAA